MIVIFWMVAGAILIAAARIVLRAVLPAHVWAGVAAYATATERFVGRALVVGAALVIVAAIYFGMKG